MDETGRLERDAAGFLFLRDAGGIYRLMLHRMPVDHVEKRVRIKGWHVGDDVVEVEGVAAAGPLSNAMTPMP